MSHRINHLKKFVETFKRMSFWHAMAMTKEDSPWHREESVAIHTEMVLDEFERYAKTHQINEETYIITYLSLLFHDVGKPPCKVVKFKPERGHYNAFHGHEQKSARMFEDFYMSNLPAFAGWLDLADAYKVMWMVENHLPYDVMHNDRKMDYLRTAMRGNLGSNIEFGFGLHLLSDTYGRISDDSAEKRGKTETFVELMNSANILPARILDDTAPTLKLLVGASGSGKSSCVKEQVAQGFEHYSFDDIRIVLAKEKDPAEMAKSKNVADEYRRAFAYCDKHRSEFGHRADVEFIKLIKDYRNIVVDNTNVSRKTRTKFVVEAKKRGYRIEAVMFPISAEDLEARATSRTDKQVPMDAVWRQYDGISIPWVGVEVETLTISGANLPKAKK